ESTCPAGLTLGPFSWMNHLVRPRQHCRRNRQAECLDGLEVDDQLYLHGLLDGEVGGLGALEDLVYVSSPPPPLRDQGSAAFARGPGGSSRYFFRFRQAWPMLPQQLSPLFLACQIAWLMI